MTLGKVDQHHITYIEIQSFLCLYAQQASVAKATTDKSTVQCLYKHIVDDAL
jgi:hypothetical protein